MVNDFPLEERVVLMLLLPFVWVVVPVYRGLCRGGAGGA